MIHWPLAGGRAGHFHWLVAAPLIFWSLKARRLNRVAVDGRDILLSGRWRAALRLVGLEGRTTLTDWPSAGGSRGLFEFLAGRPYLLVLGLVVGGRDTLIGWFLAEVHVG